MALTWISSTPVNPTNMNLMAQSIDLQPAASTFAGQAGRTITHNRGHLNYMVLINPTADPLGLLGEISFVKSNNTVVIANSGSARGAFDYVVVPRV